jgi:hypothetical protein
MGPAELAELPVAIGDELTLAREYHHPGGGTVFDMLREDQERLVLQRDDHVLVFYQRGFAFGTHAGMTLSRGDAICASAPSRTIRRGCSDVLMRRSHQDGSGAT